MRKSIWSMSIGAACLMIVGCASPSMTEGDLVETSQQDLSNIELRNPDLYADYFPAGLKANGATILLIGGSEGGLSEAGRRDALFFQDAGFNVLQMSFYLAEGQPENLEMIPLELFDNAIDWLSAREEVSTKQFGIMGTSKGAEAALIVASRHSEIDAVVAVVPSSVSWQGINWSRDGRVPEASWSLNGEAVASMPYGVWDNELGLFSLYENGLKAREQHPDAFIEIERSKAATLLVCGGADMLWPSCPMAEQLKSRAIKNDGPEVDILKYAEAGHFVSGVPDESVDSSDQTPVTFGGTVASNHAAQLDNWPKILAFLNENLVVHGDE